jgi:hypothetical protein
VIPPPDSPDFLDPSVSADEEPTLRAMAERLGEERPVPAAAFRGELRRHLVRRRERTPQMVRGRARLMALAYGGSGTVLLLVAAVGLAGIGPFAA